LLSFLHFYARRLDLYQRKSIKMVFSYKVKDKRNFCFHFLFLMVETLTVVSGFYGTKKVDVA